MAFIFHCPTLRRPEQLAQTGMKKLRHCHPMYGKVIIILLDEDEVLLSM